MTILNKIVHGLTKQISAKINSSLVSLEIIPEYDDAIGIKIIIKQLRYLGAARLLVFLQCSGMSVRIKK